MSFFKVVWLILFTVTGCSDSFDEEQFVQDVLARKNKVLCTMHTLQIET